MGCGGEAAFAPRDLGLNGSHCRFVGGGIDFEP
jgi:hypothetical protein